MSNLPTSLKGGSAIPSTSLQPCNRKGCPRFATHAVALSVPFLGKNVHDEKPLRLYLGLVLCKGDMSKARPHEFLTEDFRKAVGMASIEAGRGALDFDRAIVEPVDLTDPDYLGYLAMMAKAKGKQQ